LGASYADMVSELSTDGVNFTHKRRANLKNRVVTIPTTIKTDSLPSKTDALKQLNLTIDNDTKIISTMATPYKFNLFDSYPYIDMALKLIEKNPNILIFVIGADRKKESVWQDVYEKSDKKIDAIGYKEHNETILYKAITDIYIDSFPFASYTSLLEFAAHKIPVFSLHNEMKTLDILKNTPNLCENTQTIIKRVSEIISSNDTTKYDLSKAVKLEYSPSDRWRKSKYKLIDETPTKHQLNWDFITNIEIDSYDIKLYAISNTKKTKPPFFKDIYLKDNLKIASLLYKYNHLNLTTYITYTLKSVKNFIKKGR
jgi:hypothetical protein